MSPRELMYQKGSAGNNEGITHSQCSTEDNTKILQPPNRHVKLRNTELIRSKRGTKRKLLCTNQVESDNHLELKYCSVVLKKTDLDEKPKEDLGAIEQGMIGCESQLPRLHCQESVPVEIIFKGGSKQPRPLELKNIVKKNVISKEERNIICIPIESNKLSKNEDRKCINLQSKKALSKLFERSPSIPVDKFYRGFSKREKRLTKIEEKDEEKKVELKVQIIKDKCMERKPNITIINQKLAETPTFLDESKFLVCDSRESDPLKLDEEENMQIKSMVRTFFSGCSSDGVCCNACLEASQNENVHPSSEDNFSNECNEVETNRPVIDKFFTQDRESCHIQNSLESKDVEQKSHSDRNENALKGTNEDISNRRIKCCECNARFSTTLEVSKHLKTSGCYRKSKAKSKTVQKSRIKKVQDSKDKVGSKYSRQNSSSTCSEGSNMEEGGAHFSPPLEFSGAGSTTAFHAINDNGPSFHAIDGSSFVSPSAAFHKSGGANLSFHTTDVTAPANNATDKTGSEFHAANGPSPVFHIKDSTIPKFNATCETNAFRPIDAPTFHSADGIIPPIDGSAPCKRPRDDSVLNLTSIACDINLVFDARISKAHDMPNDSKSVIPTFHSTNDFLPVRDVDEDRNRGFTASSEIPQDISELLFSCDMTTCSEDLPSSAPFPSFLDQFCDNRQDYMDSFAVSQSASVSRSASSSPGSTMTSRYSTDASRSNSPELSSRCSTPEESVSSISTSPLLSSLSRSTSPDESKPSRSTSPQTLPGTLLGNISQILSQNGVPKLSSPTQMKPHSTQLNSPKSTITSSSSSEICRSDTFSHMFGLPVSRWHIGTLCCPTTRYSSVLKHINAHRKLQIRKYRCIGCNVKTSDYAKFINHIKQKNHHAKNAKHECGEDGCRLIFPSEASKEIHRKECHQKVSSYCKACGTQVVTDAGERAFKVLAVPRIGEHALKVHRELWM